ncbi:hypothetical protein AB1284_25755 [Bacillus sp. S2(2024)]|uniref:hypothetical protein n=1 Tax=Bacillus sp. S2(2024) TaxID=3162887 RepID=UPI003D1BC215
MKNIPESVIKEVKERGLNPEEEKEILEDLEKQFIKRNERNKKHEEKLATNKVYRKLWDKTQAILPVSRDK